MGKKLNDINTYDLYTKWSSGSGVFRCFFRTTGFVSLKHYENFILTDIVTESFDYERLFSVVDMYPLQDTVFVIDFPDNDAVKAAFMLQKHRKLKAILTFNNVLHPFGIVGSREYISSLVSCGYELEPEEMEFSGFVFVLDWLRFGQYSDEELRGNFNNQYELTDGDLPPVDMLKELNYKKLVYICRETVKEDVGSYLDYLDSEGITVVREVL